MGGAYGKRLTINIKISVRRKEQIWNVVDVNIIKRIIANTSA